MTLNNTQLLDEIFKSFSLENKPEPSARDPMQLINEETEKMLNSLNEQRNSLQNQISWLSNTSNSIKSLSDHARVECRPKMSKFVEVDALLNTSEFKLKYMDYFVLSSVKMTSDFCDKSIENMNEEIKCLDDHIERIKDQQMLAFGLTGGNIAKEVMHVDNGTVTVYENGLVDIIETDNEPFVPVERKARFKTKEERDLYLKNAKLNEKHENI